MLLLLGLASVPVGTDWALAPGPAAATSTALLTDLVGGVFFVTASVFFYLDWRVRESAARAWLVAAMALLACQLLGSAALALDPADARRRELGWPLTVDLVVICLVVAMSALGAVGRRYPGADPLLVGLSVGVLGTITKPALSAVDAGSPFAQEAMLAASVAAYGVLGALVLRHALAPWVSVHLATAVAGIAAAQVVARIPRDGADLTAGLILLCSGALWAGAAIALHRRSLEEEHARVVWAESSLLANELSNRASREAMHALKSTVNGLAKASELLSRPDLPPEARQRLEQTVSSELARMERLLTPSPVAPREPEPIDLDETLDAVLDLHRVQGRTFSWSPTGTSVLGRQDDIREALNILLDNAAEHGDPTHGRIDVSLEADHDDMVRIAVTDDGPGVPAELRQRIFEWGERGPSSNGQGIGLHMARRLVREQGGSLTLSEASAGSSFVIRLPAARRSEETLRDRTQHSSR